MSSTPVQRYSVKLRVIVITLLALTLGLWALAWYAAALLKRDAERRVSAQQEAVVQMLARQLDAQTSTRLQALNRVAQGVAAEQTLAAGALPGLLQAQPALLDLFSGGLLVFDEAGAVLASAPPASTQASQRLNLTAQDQTWLNQLTRAAVAPPALGAAAVRPTMTLVAPLATPGAAPRRWLLGAVPLHGDGFLDRQGTPLSGRGSQFVLLARAPRAVVAATDGTGALVSGAAAQASAVTGGLLGGALGTRTVNNAVGVAVITSVAPIAAADWQLAAQQPLREALAPIDGMQRQLWLVAALLTLLIGGAAWWMLRRQFRTLTDAADALAVLSDPPLPSDARGDEVAVLMDRINHLLAQIRDREHALDVQTDELTQINQQLQAILQHVPQLVWLKDRQGRYVTCNARFEAFFDLPVAKLQGHTDADFFPPEQARLYREDDEICLQSRTMLTTQRWLQPAGGAAAVLLEVNKIALRDAQGQAQAVLGIGQDMTERWRLAQFEQLRNTVLERVVQDGALPTLLQTLADGLHQLQPDWSCALLLVQDGRELRRLRVMASAALNDDFVRALDGQVVAEGVCGCASAALTGKRVVVRDIAAAPSTPAYRQLAQQAGLASCWSEPLFDIEHRVIGVFSVYRKKNSKSEPDAASRDLLVQLARLAEIALQRLHAGERLRESEASFRVLTENTPEAVLVHRHGTIVYANPAAMRLFGANALDELLQKPTQALVAPEFLQQQAARMQSIERGEVLDAPVASRFLRLDGNAFDVEVQGTAIAFNGQPAIHVSIRDVTQRAQTQRQLQLAASVFENAIEGILITDATGNIADVNASFTRITGYSRQEVLGQNPRLLQSGRHDAPFYQALWQSLLQQGTWSGEVCNRRKDGQIYTQLLHISAVRDAAGQVLQFVGLFSDITARKDQEQRLNYLAHFDVLTGLPNRALHADRLGQAMANAMRRHKKLGVAFVDLDGFKSVNDTYGHDAGDQVLIAVAKRMRQALREVDTLSRIGGDEFAAIIVDLDYESDCDPLLQRLLAAANEPVWFNGVRLQVSASVGVTFYPQHQDTSPDQLLRQADQAMYQAKHKGKNRLQVSGFGELAD